MLDTKHMMGQHDQREHRGDRYTGRYSDVVAPPRQRTFSLSRLSMSIGKTEGRFVGKQALIGFPDNEPRTQLSVVRNELTTARQGLIQAKKDWDIALKTKNTLRAQSAADMFAKQMAKIEEIRRIYNKAVEDYQSINKAQLSERNDLLRQLREEYSLAAFDLSVQ